MRVRYAETDGMGVVYHANYFVWFEVGRCELLRSLGGTYREMETSGMRLPVIEAHCEFRTPAYYDDELEVSTTGSLLSSVRVKFCYQVIRRADRTVLAVGQTVHASTNATGRPRRLPAKIQAALT